MAILDTIKKIIPYRKSSSGYEQVMISSQSIGMDDGSILADNIQIVDILQCDLKYGEDGIIEGNSYHTCTGTIKSDKKISDCKFKAFFICSNYGVPMSDPTFLVRGDYNVTVQQPVRNYTSIDHSVITTIGVICYK